MGPGCKTSRGQTISLTSSFQRMDLVELPEMLLFLALFFDMVATNDVERSRQSYS